MERFSREHSRKGVGNPQLHSDGPGLGGAFTFILFIFLFETCFLKEILEKDVDLQFKKTCSSCCTRPTNISGKSDRHIWGISEPDAMHPKVLRPTNDSVSTQLQPFPAGRTTACCP
jgi:hypothetical protein